MDDRSRMIDAFKDPDGAHDERVRRLQRGPHAGLVPVGARTLTDPKAVRLLDAMTGGYQRAGTVARKANLSDKDARRAFGILEDLGVAEGNAGAWRRVTT